MSLLQIDYIYKLRQFNRLLLDVHMKLIHLHRLHTHTPDRVTESNMSTKTSSINDLRATIIIDS